MSLNLLWSNLATYSLQVALVVGAAAFVPAALRLRAPRGRLIYWHLLLLACLLLPLVRPWRAGVVDDNIGITTTVLAVRQGGPAPRSIPWTELALAVVAGGILSRLVWLAVGYARLQRYRRHSVSYRVDLMGAGNVDFRISDDIASPVTFGILRPVVLLPRQFPELPSGLRDAILCHELLHVERYDWFYTFAEELVRAVLWFHPAIWWLLGEIQLAREQAVDHEVIERTEAREEYVDALLAIAGARHQADLAPAPLFLRRRHLKQRVVSIFEEVRMSKTKLFSTLAAGLGVLTLACWLVTATFPLAAAPQSDGAGVAVDLGGATVLHRPAVGYPAAARGKGIQGDVSVELTLDGAGNVTDAKVIAGPEELRKEVLQSVLQWHFAREAGGTRRVTVSFRAPNANAAATATPRLSRTAEEVAEEQRMTASLRASMAQQDPMAGKTIKMIRVNGLSDAMSKDLLARLPVHEGDAASRDSLRRLTDAVKAFDEHLNVSIGRLSQAGDPETEIGIIITAPASPIIGGVMGAVPAGASTGGVLGGIIRAVPAAGAPAATAPDRVKVGGAVAATKLVRQPRPVYPPDAKEARIQGVVKLAAVIGKDGSIIELAVMSGHPLLVQSALDAVKQWVYAPTFLNGNPIEVATQIDVNYTLSQ
jgi:TonB family protein